MRQLDGPSPWAVGGSEMSLPATGEGSIEESARHYDKIGYGLNLCFPFTGCVTLAKLLNISGISFS